MSHTSLQESCLKLSLVDSRLGLFQNSSVGNVRYVVGLADHGNLELVLNHAGDLNGLLQSIKVLLLEFEECDVVRNLVRDRIGCGLRVGLAEVRQSSVQLRSELDVVDIVLLEGLVDAKREARPDDAIGIDGRNKEDRLGGLDVVDVVAVGEVAPGKVVEESALTIDLSEGVFKLSIIVNRPTGKVQARRCPRGAWSCETRGTGYHSHWGSFHG